MTDLRSRVQDSLSGSYAIERELGGGGMAHVFVADEIALGRKVVVKVLSPELSVAMSAPRFEREIRVAASLQQANIVPVLSAGEMDGLPYYTMPYVEGESLRTRIARGPIPIAEVVSILRDVARALAYAHERGVVHRDIKPDNVLLSGHTAVVTDFGIAKAIAAAATGPTGATLTQLGMVVGTPAYMAPEQAAGDPATDQRADIYSFGCLAYELLAAQPPFAGLPPHKLVVAHMSEAPKPIGELRADCPPALASLVMQCLEKEPDSRPPNATELLRQLDAVASAPQPAMPAILIGGRSMLLRAIAVYVVLFAAVALLARAAIIAIGLPGWVFPGALILMSLGLPAILFTAYTQYVSHRAATTTPTFTPGGTPSPGEVHGTIATLAMKASPHISWKRVVHGGIAVAAAFVLLVAGFMLLRSLGIGPAASLLAAGKLSASDQVIVAAFDAPRADSSLGAAIAEAVRTGLSQSRAVRVMPTSEVISTLEQMQRPDSARVDFRTAREIALRTGAKAVVSGSIVAAGSGYVVTTRLVAAENGDELASFSESAKDAGELIPTVDRLTKELREKIGESLKSVRAAPRLDQVTTASIGALRSYAAGLHANDILGDYPAAIRHYHHAIEEDSTFAMAYVQMAYSLMSLGGAANMAKADSALTTAFRLRDRLPRRERFNVEGAYYSTVTPDRRKAIAALERAVELDSTNYDAANSLGVARSNVRDYDGAEQAYRLALANAPNNGTILMNLADAYGWMGKFREFDSVMTLIAAHAADYPTGAIRFDALWNQRRYDDAEQLAEAEVDSAPPGIAAQMLSGLNSLALLQGRLHEAERYFTQMSAAIARTPGGDPNAYDAALQRATATGLLRGDTARGLAILDSVLRSAPLATVPPSSDRWVSFAFTYAQLGNPAKARSIMTRHLARLDTLARDREYSSIEQIHAIIDLAEGKTDSAIFHARAGERKADGLPSPNCVSCVPLLTGMAFDRAGEPDSARKYLVQYVGAIDMTRSGIDRYELAPTLYRLGELYESAHDTTHAVEYYDRFADLWKNADADLQPRVAEARSRVEQLERARQ